jgi:hypothetical protein
MKYTQCNQSGKWDGTSIKPKNNIQNPNNPASKAMSMTKWGTTCETSYANASATNKARNISRE